MHGRTVDAMTGAKMKALVEQAKAPRFARSYASSAMIRASIFAATRPPIEVPRGQPNFFFRLAGRLPVKADCKIASTAGSAPGGQNRTWWAESQLVGRIERLV
jgi:hypothetical protein